MSTDVKAKTQKGSPIDLSTTEENLSKIRKNLLELKLLYLQEKKANEMKS